MGKEIKYFHNGCIIYREMSRSEAECLLKASLDPEFADINIRVRREYERDQETGERKLLDTYNGRIDILHWGYTKSDNDYETVTNMRDAYAKLSERLDEFFKNNLE